MPLDKAGILKAGRKIHKIQIQEWEEWVFLRAMSCAEHERFIGMCAESGKDAAKLTECKLYLVANALCDEQGNRLFADGEWKDLRDAHAAGIEHVFEEAQRINGLTEEARAALRKNS